MSASLACNDLASEAAAPVDAVPAVSEADKPGFFARIFDAIGRSSYVQTADGEIIYLLPHY